MKKTIKLLTACCLALLLLAVTAGGVSAATAASVWVNGVELTEDGYLADNSATAASETTTEPVSYVAWYHDGTLTLNNAEIVKGYTKTVCYGTGACGVYADGDIVIVLKGENQIKNDVTEIRNGIVAQGNLTVTSEEFGTLNISTQNFGLYSDTGNIIISGTPQMDIVNNGCDMRAKGAIFSYDGNIVIKDYAVIKALLMNGSGDGSSAAVNANNGNLSVFDHVTLSVESHDFTGFGCGLSARDPDGSGKGNVTISGSVNIYAMGVTYGIFLYNTLSVGKNSFVSVKGYQSGICGMDNLMITRGCLEVYGGSDGAFSDCKNNMAISESDLLMAYYDRQEPLTTPSQFEKINYVSGFGNNYIFDNNPSNIMHYYLYYPFHACQAYTDCQSWDWAQPYDCFVIENNIMGSVNKDSNYFDSTGAVTRGMVVTVMYRLAGSPALSDADYAKYNGKFSDVKKDDWYYDAVVWAYCNGVTEGMSDTSFAPQQKTSREQIVTFFWRFSDFLGYDNSGSADLGSYQDLGQVGAFAVDAFQWSVSNNIVNGTTLTTLSPKDSCTRGQMAKIITCFGRTFMDDRDWIDIGDF